MPTPGRPLVYLRIRPPITDSETNQEVFCEVNVSESTIAYTKPIGMDAYVTLEKYAKFDQIFDTDSTQSDVFESLWPKILATFETGFSSTVLMYGATGSGKTFTMDGKLNENTDERKNRGICPRSIKKIFHFLDNNAEKGYEVQLRYVEAYNDKVFDLLNKSVNNEVKVQKALKWTNDLNPTILKSHKHFNLVYGEALKKRTTAANNSNKQSSRSHSIVNIKVTWISNKNGGMQNPRTAREKITSEIYFVDLAGAEQFQKKRTTRMEERLNEELRNQEGICINKALSALSHCVSQLNLRSKESNKRKTIIIPFQNNILTKLLSSSFNGNNALMLVLCIPNIKSVQQDNRKTVDFGLRCLSLKVNPKRNEVLVEYDIIETMNNENSQYIARELESRDLPIHDENVEKVGEVDDSEEVEKLKEKLSQLTMDLLEKEYDLILLNETDIELEVCKQQLLDMKKSNDQDKNRIIALEHRIEEKTKSLNQLTEINAQLKSLIDQMGIEKEVLKDMQNTEKQLSLQILENNSAELQNSLYLSLSQITLKEEEIERLKNQILEVQIQKESAESLANTVLQLLEKKMGFQLEIEKLQINVKELEESIGDLREIFENFAESSDSFNKETETTINSLKDRYSEIENELKNAKGSEWLLINKFNEVSDQIENAIIALPSNLQTKARKDILEYERKTPAIKELKNQAQHIKDALMSLRINNQLSKSENKEFETDKKVSSKISTKSIQVSEFNEQPWISENRELTNEDIGSNLDDDLIRFRDIQHEDELYRYFSNLPFTALKLGKLLSIYKSFLPRFFKMDGIQRIIQLMKTTKFNSTFSSLCFLLESALYNNESQDIAYNYGIIDVLIIKFSSSKWSDEEAENIKINTLDMITTLAKYEKTQLKLREKSILSTITDLIFHNGVQSVISSSLKCIVEIFPTIDNLKHACSTYHVNDVFTKIVQCCDNPSIYVQKSAAMCIARLCSQLDYQNSFLELSFSNTFSIPINIVQYLMHKVTTTADNISSDSFSFALLSLIISDNKNVQFCPDNNILVMNKLYESICTTHADNLSKTILSLFITGMSKKFPYKCKVIRGVWNPTDSIDSYSDGGSLYNIFFHKNPMYKLKVNNCDSEKTSVSITLLRKEFNQDSEYVIDESLCLKDVFCFVAVYSKSDIENNLKDTNCQLEGILEDSIKLLWNSGQRFVFNDCVQGIHFSSTLNNKQTKSTNTVQLDSKEEYIIVPYKNVRSRDGNFVLSVTGNCEIILEELQDKLYRRCMTTNISFPQIYVCNEFLGFSQADWRNFPQILVKSKRKSLIYVILSAKDFDDRLDLFSRQNDEEYSSPSDLANDFKSGGYLHLRVFKNLNYQKDRRYIESADHNIVAYSRFSCRRQGIVAFVTEPGSTYSISMSLKGAIEAAGIRSYPFRIQLISSESDVEFTPISSYNNEWKSFSTTFSLALNDQAIEFFLVVKPNGDTPNDMTLLDLSLTIHATTDNELFKVVIIDEISHETLFEDNENINNGISSRYKEGNISLMGKSLTMKNGSGLIKIKLIRQTREASNQNFRIFGFSNLSIKLQVEYLYESICLDYKAQERFNFAANIPFYSYGYFEEDAKYLFSNKESDENNHSGEYIKIDKILLQKLYDKISYQTSKLDEQASKIETLNTRVRPPFINEALIMIQNTVPDFLIRKQILLKLYNPTVEFIRELFIELNKIYGFGEELFTNHELLETMDPSVKIIFLKRLVMFICKLTSENYLSLVTDASEIVESKASSQSVKACNTIIKIMCQEVKKDNDKTKWITCVQSTINEFFPRGGGFKAILSLVK